VRHPIWELWNFGKSVTVDTVDQAFRSDPSQANLVEALDALDINTRDVVERFTHKIARAHQTKADGLVGLDIFYDGYAVAVLREQIDTARESLREKIESIARQIGYDSMRDAERGGMTTMRPYMDIGFAAQEFHHAERSAMSDDADRRAFTVWHLLNAAKLYATAYDLRHKTKGLKFPPYAVLPPAFPRSPKAPT